MQKGYYSADRARSFAAGREGHGAAATRRSGGHDHGEVARQAENAGLGARRTKLPSASSTKPSTRAPETVLLSCNRGAMPQEMFLNQIRRIGKEVLPRLQAHKITRVKFAEGIGD